MTGVQTCALPISHFGEELLRKIAEKLQEVSVIEKEPKLEGRNMSMTLTPKKA